MQKYTHSLSQDHSLDISGDDCAVCLFAIETLSTFCCNDLTGRLSVSVKCRFFGKFGFEEGVWMAKHRMKIAMKMTKAMPIRSTAHQNSVTHCAIVNSVS
jgi:hypothetical protein